MKSLIKYISECKNNQLSRYINEANENDDNIDSKDALNKQVRNYFKVKEDYFDAAIEAYKNGNKPNALSNIKKYCEEILNIFRNQKFGKLSLNVFEYWPGAYLVKRDYYRDQKMTGTEFNFSKFSRKQNGLLIDEWGFYITLKIDEPWEILQDYGYDDEYRISIYVSIYKDGTLEINANFNDKCKVPADFSNDVKNMFEFFKECGIETNVGAGRILGSKRIGDKFDIATILRDNLSNIQHTDAAKALELLCKALQRIDKNCKISFGRSYSSSEKSHNYIGHAYQFNHIEKQQAELIFFGNKHILTIEEHTSSMVMWAKISFDDITRGISARAEDGGDGYWKGGNYKISDEVCDILEKERKD